MERTRAETRTEADRLRDLASRVAARIAAREVDLAGEFVRIADLAFAALTTKVMSAGIPAVERKRLIEAVTETWEETLVALFRSVARKDE